MSIENWIGVAEDVVNLVSFFAKIIGEEADVGSKPYALGPLQFYKDSDSGDITADNIGDVTVTLALYGEPAETATATPVTIAPGNTLDVTTLIDRSSDGGGIVSVFPTPTSEEMAALDVTATQAIIIGALTVSSIAALQIAADLTVSYDGSNGLTVNYKGTGTSPIVIAIINSITSVVTAVLARRQNPASGDAGTTYALALPDEVVASDTFKSITVLLVDGGTG